MARQAGGEDGKGSDRMQETTASESLGQRPGARALLAVEGMHCGSCVALIEETLVEDLGVPSAEVDLAAGRAEVTYDPSTHTVDDLCAAVAAAGYRATPIDPAPPG